MSVAIVDRLRASGQLHELVGRAALESIAPMCGADGAVQGRVALPWETPPAVLAIMSLNETSGGLTRSVAWLGGTFGALAALAEPLLGELPVTEDELFEDCVQELTNIFAGRMQ